MPETPQCSVRLLIATVATIAFIALPIPGSLASGSPSQPTAPSQRDCTSGSLPYTWNGLGLTSPGKLGLADIHMTVDGQTVVDPTFQSYTDASPPTTPPAGMIGLAICPFETNAKKTDVLVIQSLGGGTYTMNLTNGVAPDGTTVVTQASTISFNLSDLGSLARYYSFSLVHGVVSSWSPANLGTDSASLSLSLSPASTPVISNTGYSQCSATPPNCTDPQSDADILQASLDMDFNQTGQPPYDAGAYFGLTSAVSGFVLPGGGSNGATLDVTLGSPHLMANGSPEIGSMQAFLPNSVVESIFGLAPGSITGSSFDITRTASDSVGTSTVPFTASAVTGGVLISVNAITFSTPTYAIGKAGGGYKEAAADGGIFTFGDARFHGSEGGHALTRPIVGMASTPDGGGYWEVASDGGIFTFGDARFQGSEGGHPLTSPVVGLS